MMDTAERQLILGVPQRPLRRTAQSAVIGGVCGGVARRLGLRERTVRIFAVVTSLIFGAGAVVYVAMWIAVPRSGDLSVARRVTSNVRSARLLSLVLLLGGIGLAVALRRSSLGVAAIVWAVVITTGGAIVVWRWASPEEKNHVREIVRSTPLVVGDSTSQRVRWLRIIIGALFVATGLNVLSRVGGVWGAAVPAIIGTFVLVVGALVILAPWWLTNLRELSNERRERVRAEERAAIAAHVHDSVLQTLALIERSSTDRAEIVRLARRQERELREWLFGSTPSDVSATSLAERLKGLQREIEADYDVTVELVTVGDCAVTDDLSALVAAGREAMINAAKWSGETSMSVFLEVAKESVELFVRDQGRGFEPAQVGADRQGLESSIRRRVIDHGGWSKIRSAQGQGCEVVISMPR